MAVFRLVTLSPTPMLRRIDDPGDTIRFSKQLAVLIYLAARPAHRALREELASLLWGGASPLDARQALRQLVYQIRRGTGPDLLRGDAELTLGPDAIEFDVDIFRSHLAEGRLEGALDLYEADFLSTVSLPGAREFDHWAEGLRQQLAAEQRQVLRVLIARRTDEGRWRDAAQFAERLADADPANLEPRIRRIELLSLAGDAVRAAVAAEDARRLAADQAGDHTPSEVEDAIARALAGGSGPERRAAEGFPRHPEMVGRAREFRRVVDAWTLANEGRGGAVLVVGEAGVGKTRLVRELARRLQRDRGRTVVSACHAVEQSDRFAPFLEAIGALSASPGLAGAVPTCLEVLAALVPEVAARFASAVTPRPLPIPPQAVAASLLDAFAAIADEAPLALVVEDLHWAPSGTAEFAHQLARKASSTHLLLVFTARDSGGSAATTQSVRALSGSGAVDPVYLEPLDRTDVEQLLASMAQLPADDSGSILARRVHDAADGIPLYVLEVLKSLYDAGAVGVRDGTWVCAPGVCDEARPLPVPGSTEAILAARLASLGERPAAVLAALAVVGREAAVEDLARISGLALADVRSAVDVLRQRRLIGRPPGRGDAWAVVHDELSAAALRSAPPAFVELFEARAADVAEERASQGVPRAFAAAAIHAGLAGDAARAVVLAARAAADVEEVSGPEAGRGALGVLVGNLAAAVRPDVERHLRRVLEGRTSARHWLDDRTGVTRRRRVALALVPALALFGAGLWAVFAASRTQPLGGGFLVIGDAGSTAADKRAPNVRALAIDEGLAARSVSLRRVPRGLAAGYPAWSVRPDQRAVVWACPLPGRDPTGVCQTDLATGGLTPLVEESDDVIPLGWLTDGSALVVSVGRLLGAGSFTYDLAVAAPTGRIQRFFARDRSYVSATVLPQRKLVLAGWGGVGGGGAELLSLDGRSLGAVEWCGPRAAAVSPGGSLLACVSPRSDEVAVGEAKPGATHVDYRLPGRVMSLTWSPDGRYVACGVAVRERTELYLIDADGVAEPRPLRRPLERRFEVLGWSAADGDGLPAFRRVEPQVVALQPGERAALRLATLDSAGRVLDTSPYIRWVVGDAAVARTDSGGTVTADRPGSTWVVALLGPRRVDSAEVRVSAARPRVLLSEGFDRGLDSSRWRAFGNPAPRVIEGAGRNGTAGFHNNGDHKHSSGIALRQALALERGLTVEYWAQVPFRGPEWEESQVVLTSAPADSFFLREGPPTSTPGYAISANGPTVQTGNHSGGLGSPEGGDTETTAAWLTDGRWHRYRVVVYPFGEARWFVDGVEVFRPVPFDPVRLPRATLLVHGRSVGTLVMVDDITLWEGVVLDPLPRRLNPGAGPARRAIQGGYR